jgi:prevent-host-death family protein
MKVLTTSELKQNFKQILEEVESGKSFFIQDKNSNFVLIPYQTYQEVDELTRMYTEHEEGS